jgi:drug/metabolite transporter (DMT)-like permease
LRSVLGFAYLVAIGSLIAFTAYAWLLQNAPLPKVATYAYVNPVVAIFLGAIVLGEKVTAVTVVAAAVIVASVAMVVRVEAGASSRRTAARTASRGRSGSASG